MGFMQFGGLVGGILAIIAGVIVLVKPQILAWVIGIFLILSGALAVLAAI